PRSTFPLTIKSQENNTLHLLPCKYQLFTSHQEIPTNMEFSNLIIPSHKFTREEENKRSIKNLKITSTKTMLHTLFLKPF
ncbi:hypothetical protein GIB67_035762, partial [Kingdonia uniflora]